MSASVTLVAALALHGMSMRHTSAPRGIPLARIQRNLRAHVAGIGFGLALGKAYGGRVSRLAGAFIALCGLYFLIAKLIAM